MFFQVKISPSPCSLKTQQFSFSIKVTLRYPLIPIFPRETNILLATPVFSLLLFYSYNPYNVLIMFLILITRKLLKRFGIPVSHLAKNLLNRYEARGIFATDRLSLKQRAFPALNQGRFQNSTFEQMIEYLFSHRREANNFASSYDFFSEYLTPEGFQLFSHIVAWLPDYNNQPQPRNYLARMVNNANFKRNFSRPDSGLSAITRALKTSATNLGARIYKKEEIKVIEENREKQFKLNTTKYKVRANKLVIAIPPQPMKQVKGSVAEKIQKDSIFQSVGLMLSFKGFAVFEEAWWQDDSTGSRYLADEQVMVSTSDCLGSIFPYK